LALKGWSSRYWNGELVLIVLRLIPATRNGGQGSSVVIATTFPDRDAVPACAAIDVAHQMMDTHEVVIAAQEVNNDKRPVRRTGRSANEPD